MDVLNNDVQQHMEAIVAEWIELENLESNDLFVIGCSTSEVHGAHIGTSGSDEIAEVIFTELQVLKDRTNIRLAFQCCEHLNRAVIIEREVAEQFGLEIVSVIPVKTAGGSMATYAYHNIEDPVVVEGVQAKAGMDIGETMIGMQLKHVAIPLRFKQATIGNARVTGAITRPKLIGGARAQYEDVYINKTCK